jgi:hypothetical protein
VEEARGSISGCRGGEENVEGELGGETECGAKEDAMEILFMAFLFGTWT